MFLSATAKHVLCLNGAAADRCGKPVREEYAEQGVWLLQWGRSTSPRKTLTPHSSFLSSHCFSGAAAHRCGKRQAPQAGQYTNVIASMGPQHIAAENIFCDYAWPTYFYASMGPQHIAAENQQRNSSANGQSTGFNGAAAHRCGKRVSVIEDLAGDSLSLQWGRSTSLRKTVAWLSKIIETGSSFNGAAAHRCGKR